MPKVVHGAAASLLLLLAASTDPCIPMAPECPVGQLHDAGIDRCAVPCPDDMVPVGEVCMDRYEASRPDATDLDMGADTTVATSRAGVLPWFVNPVSAADLDVFAAACGAAGKHLCRPEEWFPACTGPDQSAYVFGDTFDPLVCNSVDTFCADHCAANGIDPCNTGTNCGYAYYCFHVMPTGSFPGCTNAHGTFDINGNVWEVVPSEADARGFEVRGGAFNCGNPAARLDCTYNANWNQLYAGFRCCRDR